jgi:hypothetical protein
MKVLILFLLFFSATFQLLAQVTKADSVAFKITIATSDARHFKTNKQINLAYRKHRITHTSDYFKPITNAVDSPNFTADSVYVKAYKNAAYEKTTDRRNFRRYVLMNASYLLLLILAGFVN